MIVRLTGLLVALAVAVCGAPPGVSAQDAKTGKVARIGRLSPLSAEADARNLDALRKGLHDLGWVEGRSFALETRFADGIADRLPALAAQLVQQRVDIIVVGSSPGALAAMKATTTIPIVIVTTGDPVADGIITSLARPGANVTGVTALGQALNTKRLELLKGALPGVSRVGVLINPASAYTAAFLREKDAAARTLGLELRILESADPGGLEKALALAASERVEAVMVQTNPMFITQRRRIVELVARHRLPAVYGEREFVDAGGLMFYGASLAGMYRDAAAYVDRILRGAKPADLPVEQPTRLELVLNLKAARGLGLAIPAAVLARADHIIH
jgi:putative tryptophan/tyrosine transport system substrate-binding protein